MKLFMNSVGEVFGFSDEQISRGMTGGMAEITKAELDAKLEKERQEYLDSLPVPAVVSMRQARLALLTAGRLDDVSAAIAALPEPDKTAAGIEWEYAGSVDRNGPITQMLAGSMGLTSEDLDQLFETASGL